MNKSSSDDIEDENGNKIRKTNDEESPDNDELKVHQSGAKTPSKYTCMQKCCIFTVIFIVILLIAHIILSHLLYDYADILGIPWLGKDDSQDTEQGVKTEAMIEIIKEKNENGDSKDDNEMAINDNG